MDEEKLGYVIIEQPEVRSAVEEVAHEIVREEIASLAGKALRRLQDENFTRSFEHNAATDAAKEVIGHFWGEVLAEYGDDG
jgi:dephospho-CoA kinase